MSAARDLNDLAVQDPELFARMRARPQDFEREVTDNAEPPAEDYFEGTPEPPPDLPVEATQEQPTADEPLRGVPELARVAITGRAALLALASRPVHYLWQDIAIAGIVVVVAGGVGCGKTTLLFLVMAARANLAAPVKVLGREVTPAPSRMYVVLLEAEHGDSSAARKLARSCKLLGIDESALDRVILIARRAVRIGSPAWLDIERLIAAGLVSDVLLDTLARVAPSDANAEGEQVAIFDRVAQAIERAPAHVPQPVVWVAAHTKKDAVGDALEDVAGSAQRTGQADTVLLVKAERRDGRVISSKVVFAKLREDPDEYPAPVEFAITPQGIASTSSPATDERPLEERILERLKLGPKTKNALEKDLGRNAADLEDAITSLFETRRIASTTVTIRGRGYKAFELRNDARLDARRADRPTHARRTPDETTPDQDGGLFSDG
ncbi:MAG TPA: AAA family ATPase [Polyangiaceae bacterium]